MRLKKEETVDYSVKSLWHGIARMYNQFGQPYDITASVGFVLLNIDVKSGTAATKIAPLLGMESGSLTRTIKAMEKKGWIYRKKDALDGRSVRIFLSEEGKKKRELSSRAVREFNHMIRQVTPSHQLNMFFETLRQIMDIAENPSVFDRLEKEIAEELCLT